MRYKRILPFIILIVCSTSLQLIAQGIDLSKSEGTNSFGLHLEDKKKLSPKLSKQLEILAVKLPQEFSVAVTNRSDFNNWMEEKNCNFLFLEEYPSINALRLELDNLECLNLLIKCPFVLYVNALSIPRKAESRVRNSNFNVNQINLAHHYFPDLDGQGISISIKEPRYDTSDLDLKGRSIISNLEGTFISSHATDMATLIGGGGNSFVSGKGVSFASLLTSSDFNQVFPDPLSSYQQLGVTIQNHSYGTEIENFYGLLAKAYDASVQENPTLLHVFSAGNQGLATDSIGAYAGIAGFANLTGNYKLAKNILTVGFLNEEYEMDSTSSKGPAFDGRVKPELSAYSLDGASNAAALTSGVATLLQQSYRNINNKLPSSALLKAVLLNSAEDIGFPGPDFNSGFGNLNAFRAISGIEEERHFEGLLSSNEMLNYDLVVPPNTSELKITLVWNDPDASINSTKALVNDLDMQLQNQSSSMVWQPWVLSSFPHSDSLNLPAQRKADHLNNIEQISLANPISGNYQISINAANLVDGPQPFFIAYQLEEKENFEWTAPTRSDNVPQDGESLTAFRWATSFEGLTGELEYSLDEGNSWQLIKDQVDLSVGYLFWEAPAIWSTAIARMTIGGQVFPTDTFSISRPLLLKVGFNCKDSVYFSWPAVSEIEAYTFYSMGEKYLKPIIETKDTFLVIQKSSYSEKHFAVAPQFKTQQNAIKSLTLNYENQAIACYLLSFLASVIPEEGVNLALELGTTYEVEELSFEKWSNGIFQTIESNIIFQKRYEYLDPNPSEGLNIYRAKILLSNGKTIFSPADTVYFLQERAFLVFPNPLLAGEELNIYTQPFEGESLQFQVFTTNGQLVYTSILETEFSPIFLPPLSKGLYFYTITGPDLVLVDKLLLK